MIETKNRPPFGVRAKRFSALGYHPHFETRPGTFKYSKVSPQRYDPKLPKKFISKIPRWKRQQEIEEFCRRLSYKGEHLVKALEWIKSVNGPGWQDIRPPPPQYCARFTKSDRFKVEKFKAFSVSGPGTYGKNHDPYKTLEEKSHSKGFSFSSLPSFEYPGSVSRTFVSERSYHLPPNLYNIKSFTDELLSKRVSKRGPYQLFTVERFPSQSVGSVGGLSALKPPMNPLDLRHPCNSYKGKFHKCGKDSVISSRLALQDTSYAQRKNPDLGPGCYEPYPTPVISQACAPFNSSVLEARPVVKCGLSPPPGRYHPFGKKKILGNGMKSVFLSKSKRDLFIVQKFSWFDV